MSRTLLAFKQGPTVELRLDPSSIEVRDNRVLFVIDNGDAWFSWDEWRDLARRVEHSIRWIESNTPDDVTGTSFSIDP